MVNTREHVLEMYKGDKDKMARQQSDLTEALVAQKWTDLVFGEVTDSMSVSCLEQGRLFLKLRQQYVDNVYDDVRA